MRSPSPISETSAEGPREADTQNPGSAARTPAGRVVGERVQAAGESLPQRPSPAADPALTARADSPDEAEGRRTLSTAFVRVGPDGYLTVELRDGQAMVLRNVVMGPREYCGQVLGASGKARYCGGYGEVSAARPGGGPNPGDPDPRTLNPVQLEPISPERD